MPTRLVRLPEVRIMTGLSRSTIYAKMKVGRFPRSVQLGVSLTAWVETEIEEWIADQINGRDNGARMGAYVE